MKPSDAYMRQWIKPSLIQHNGFSPDQRQAIYWTNAAILLIGPSGTSLSEIRTFLSKKIYLKMLSGKEQPFFSHVISGHMTTTWIFIWNHKAIKTVCPTEYLYNTAKWNINFIFIRYQNAFFTSRHWSFVREIQRSSVVSPHSGQWHGALIFSLICGWTRLSKQLRRRWFETPSRSLCR